MAEERYEIDNKVDKILVLKSKRKLYLLKGTDTVFTFPINLGPNPVGQKEREGDGKTPEGTYRMGYRVSNDATFYSVNISYPNAKDIKRAKAKGLTPGSNIMVHAGGIKPRTKKDWTNGCIALTNTDMAIFAKYTDVYDPIEIRK